jgi:hypothetical protein
MPPTDNHDLLQEILTEQRSARDKAEKTALLVANIDAKMTALVGEEGNGGTLGEIDKRVTSLERFRWMGTGIAFLLGWAFTMVKYLFPTSK